MPELDALLRMLYASEKANPALLTLLGIHGSGDQDLLSYGEFLEVSRDASARRIRSILSSLVFCSGSKATPAPAFHVVVDERNPSATGLIVVSSARFS